MSKAKRNFLSEFTKLEISLIGILLLFALLGPYLFTQFNLFGFSFDETGPIGDTIGGITAPFINLLAAFLVYKSFREQIKANKLLSKETNHNYIISLTNEILEGIKNSLSINLDIQGNFKRHYMTTGLLSSFRYSIPEAGDSELPDAIRETVSNNFSSLTILYSNLEDMLYLLSEIEDNTYNNIQSSIHCKKVEMLYEALDLDELYEILSNHQVDIRKLGNTGVQEFDVLLNTYVKLDTIHHWLHQVRNW